MKKKKKVKYNHAMVKLIRTLTDEERESVYRALGFKYYGTARNK